MKKIFLYIVILISNYNLLAQIPENSNISSYENPFPYKKVNDTIIHIDKIGDTLVRYPYRESKIIKINNYYIANRFNNYESYVVERDNKIEVYPSPLILFNYDFINNDRIFDIDSSFVWGICYTGLRHHNMPPRLNPMSILNKVPLGSLADWSLTNGKRRDSLSQSYMLSYKLPLANMIEKTIIDPHDRSNQSYKEPYLTHNQLKALIDSTFFDFLIINSKPTYLLYNNEELSLWEFTQIDKSSSGNSFFWHKTKSYKMTLGKFRAFKHKNLIYIIDTIGQIYQLSDHIIKLKSINQKIDDITFLIDKDSDNVYFIKRNTYVETERLKDIFSRGITIF